MPKTYYFSLAIIFASFVFLVSGPGAFAETNSERLKNGKVVVSHKDIGSKKFVVGKVWIPHSVEKVWPVMVNPYEFEKNISPGMKKLEILSENKKESLMKITINYPIPFPLPQIKYTVRSRYFKDRNSSLVEFKRVSGTLKDFHGFWQAKSVCNGSKTEVIYSMYLDPGFYVPQWIIRKGVSGELPKTLKSLRRRVNSIYTTHAKPARRSITATASLPLTVRSKHL